MCLAHSARVACFSSSFSPPSLVSHVTHACDAQFVSKEPAAVVEDVVNHEAISLRSIGSAVVAANRFRNSMSKDYESGRASPRRSGELDFRRGSTSSDGSGMSSDGLHPDVAAHPAAQIVPARHLPLSASKAELDAVVTVCEQINACEWDSDLLALCSTLRSPMAFIVRQILDQWEAASVLECETETIDAMLDELERGYKPTNPYHNATHAADVAFSTHVMLMHGVKEALRLTDLQCVVCVIAAAAHDFRHPGIGANYLIAMGDELALTYNDRSPLENMHTSQFFRMLKINPKTNVFAKKGRKEMAAIRKCIIAMILATDMSVHFEFLDKFQKRFGEPLRQDAPPLSEDEQNFACSLLLHCADISNPAKAKDTYFDWTDRVLAEFYHQGDLEKANDLAVSTFFDRDKPDVAKMQSGFIQFIVRPMFTAWTAFVPDLAVKTKCMVHIETHAALWKAETQPIAPGSVFVHGGKEDWDWVKGRWKKTGQ